MRLLTLLLLIMLPFFGCSQIGFWDNPTPELPGCALYTIQTNNCEACFTRIAYVDCRGDEQDIFVDTDGSSFTVCSMSRPAAINNTPPLVGVASITRTGWCTDPIGFDYQFIFDAHNHTYRSFWRGPYNEGASGVAIFSVNSDGSSPVHIITVYRDIPETFQFNDTDPDKDYFRVDITARNLDMGIGGTLGVAVSAARMGGGRNYWSSATYVTHSFIFRKTSGVFTTYAPRP